MIVCRPNFFSNACLGEAAWRGRLSQAEPARRPGKDMPMTDRLHAGFVLERVPRWDGAEGPVVPGGADEAVLEERADDRMQVELLLERVPRRGGVEGPV
eukprot:16443337-Heterocapsa_arctica.AAC.1